MSCDTEFNLPKLTNWYKKKYLHFASQILNAQQQMTTDAGKNLLHYTLNTLERHEHMSHYPKGDRIDKNSGAQYFYHCHREDFEKGEHGHFHCFLRYKHIPKKIKPTPLSDWDKYIENPMTHLVAIGMSQTGMPIRLFTVNRWVTSEIWYDALHTLKFVKRFKMDQNQDPYWSILDKWVEGVIQLFTPQITSLHQERDKIIQSHIQTNPEQNIFMNKEIEELSSININLKKQIEWVIAQ